MSKIVSIGQAAKLLGVHVQTMRNWEKSGKLKPDSISPSGTRRYNLDRIVAISGKEVPTVLTFHKSYTKRGLSSLHVVLRPVKKSLIPDSFYRF